MNYEIITQPYKRLAKKFSLTFDEKFGYCISDVYKNDKGEYHPPYLYHNGEKYGLEYLDGCFNPYLVKYKTN